MGEKDAEKFTNATIIKKANLYFEGNVSSRTVYLESGERVTLGLMLPGEYEFGTAAKERMEVISGVLLVLLPNTDEWKTYKEGESFEISENSIFQVKTEVVSDYCCYYL